MNKVEARTVLRRELARYRDYSYEKLRQLLGRAETLERLAPSGTSYQVEMQVFWDDEPGRSLRVLGCIDDKGWTALSPLCEDFIILPDGSFVGE
jgi:hypothetical protein